VEDRLMDINATVEETKATFAVEGKLTVQTAPELEAAIGKLASSVCNIDIDLTEVGYVSSAGLRVFVACSRLAASRGGEMRLLHPCDDVYEVFDMTGLAEVLTVVR
jgi:anti-sigma B factor antagonist